MDELEVLREEIRQIDRDMVVLFEKRMALSAEVAQVKCKSLAPIYDAAREEKNIRELTALLANASDRHLFQKWYRTLMDVSKIRQEEIREKSAWKKH